MSGLGYGEQIGGADVPDNAIPVLIGARGEANEFTQGGPDVPGALPHPQVMSATLMRIEHELRRLRFASPQLGRQEVRVDQGQTDSGNGSFLSVVEGPRSGADWYVERVAVTVMGAAFAGNVAIYQGTGANASAVPDDGMFLDGLQGLAGLGSSVHSVLSPNTPYFLQGGAPLVISCKGGGVNSVQWFVRIQMREVLGQIDPLLQNQGRQ